MTEKRKLIATTVICATVATTAAAIGVEKRTVPPFIVTLMPLRNSPKMAQ